MLNKGILSQEQLGIYLECMKKSGIHTLDILITLDSSINIERLASAITTALKAHPYMNVRITEENGEPVQIIPDENFEYKPEFFKLSEADWRRKLDEILKEKFDIHGRLFRFVIAETENGKYLLSSAHHLISDGVSYVLLLRDFEKAYNGEELVPENYNAIDFAADEEKLRNAQIYKQAEEWYKEKFSGHEIKSFPLNDLNNGDTYNFYARGLEITYSEIKEFCLKNKISETALTAGVFAFMLGIYTNRKEALFETIYHGRNPKINNTFGMFVKTTPFYCSWDKNANVKDFLKTQREFLKAGRKYGIFSIIDFGKICAVNDLPIFAWQGTVNTLKKFCGSPCKEETLTEIKDTFGFELTCYGDVINLKATYNSGKYSREFIESTVEIYEHLLKEFMIREKISDVKILSDKALNALKNIHDTEWPVKERPAYRLLQDSAEKFPDKTAAIANNQKITYRELNAQANKTGYCLKEAGVKPDVIIAVMLERGIEAYIARQGVLKSGGAFLPVAPDYPDDRIKFIIQDADAEFLITSKNIFEQRKALFEELQLKIFIIEDIKNNNSIPDKNLNVQVPYDALAYCIYTSGSTGKPKGVMLMQKNLVNFVDANPKNHEILGYTQRGKISLALAALTFDVSIMEEFIPLANGMTICMANENEIHDVFALKKLCLENHVDIISTTPSFLTNLASLPEMRDVIKNLKSVDLGAEAFPSSLYTILHSINPDLYIMNGYGPTETTISCTMAVIKSSENITIGIPNANVKVVILDEDNNILPLGALGEMAILGEGVGRGYRNREDLNQKNFINLLGMPAYKSGDVALIKHNGEIDYHGRADNQVKLHGLRIELGEIETAINNFPNIDNSAVIVRNEGGEYLAGYFTASTEINTEELRKHLMKSLTLYMIPNVLMQLKEFPLTANGKIDRKNLPKPVRHAEDFIKPRSELEQKVFDCAAKVLNNNQFGVTTNLFEAGLTSLGIITLNVMLHNEFEGKAFKVEDINNNPTVEALAKFISTSGNLKEWEKREYYPLTQKQKANVYVLNNVTGDNTTSYNIPVLYRLGSKIDVERLKNSIEKAINAHSYLKAVFCKIDDEYKIKRNDSLKPEVEIINVKKIPSADELIRPYKMLAGDRLYRMEIYLTDTGGKYFYLDVNHSICDGDSLDIFFKDIQAAYNGHELEPEKYTGYEQALDEEALRNSEALPNDEKYFAEMFKGINDFNFIPPHDEATKGNGAKVDKFKIPLNISEQIKKYCTEKNLSLNAFFCSVYGFVLGKFLKRDTVIFNTVWNGRNDARLYNSVFMCARNIYVSCNKKVDQHPNEYVASTSAQILNTMSHNAISLVELFLKYDIKDTLFIYQGMNNVTAEKLTFENEQVEIVDLLNTEGALLDFSAQIFLLETGEFEIGIAYQKNFYLPETIKNFADEFIKITDDWSQGS